jgi:hypothetical protein
MSKTLAAPLLLLMLASCAPESTSIRGKERGAFIPMVRLRQSLDGKSPSPPDSHEMRGRSMFEFDIAYGHGESDQTIDAGEDVDFAGTQIFGPAKVDSEYDLAAVRARVTFGADFGTFRFEGTTGLGANHFDLRVSSGALEDRDHTTSLGFLLGLRGAAMPTPWSEFYVTVEEFLGAGSGDPVEVSMVEVGVTLTPPDLGAGLVLGWRRWRYLEERSGSDVNLQLSGLMLGVEVRY